MVPLEGELNGNITVSGFIFKTLSICRPGVGNRTIHMGHRCLRHDLIRCHFTKSMEFKTHFHSVKSLELLYTSPQNTHTHTF